jgi:hypothetical protein
VPCWGLPLGPVVCGLLGDTGAELLARMVACKASDSLCSSSCLGLAFFRPACCFAVQTACSACNEACMLRLLQLLVALVVASLLPRAAESGASVRQGMAGLVHQGALLAALGDVASGCWPPAVLAVLLGLLLDSGGYCRAAVVMC